MMRRLPAIFHEAAQQRFQKWWPWALGGACSVLYFYNPEPFDEIGAGVLTKLRKPLLKGTEWLDLHDVDPETLALELPPDQLFGPLSLAQQMDFLLQGLKADNELAGGYLARMCLDNMDLSLDPPLISEKEILDNKGKELLDFAVLDFSEKRIPRKHKFFHPDNFILVMNWLSIYPNLANYFVTQHDGVALMLRALRHAKEDYSRVLAMRCLMLFAIQQPRDGDIERTLLSQNAFKTVVDAYRQSTGDPTDTRSLTTLLSSMIRHYPSAAVLELKKSNCIEVVLSALNISRYKGVPQHLRLIEDIRSLPSKTKVGSTTDIDRELINCDAIPVLLGVMEVFPEYYECVNNIVHLVKDLTISSKKDPKSVVTPYYLLEYHLLSIYSKVYTRYKDDAAFMSDGTRATMADVAKMILEDKECRRCFDKSVSTFELDAAVKTMETMIGEHLSFLEEMKSRK